MIRAAIAALVLTLAGCVSAPTPQNGQVTLSGEVIGGGPVGDTLRILDRYAAQGVQVVIASDAYSDGAVGILSRRWSNLCVMPHVSLHLHAAHAGGVYVVDATQDVHDAILDPTIRAEFNAWLWQRAGRTETMHLAIHEWLTYPATDLARRGVVRLC